MIFVPRWKWTFDRKCFYHKDGVKAECQIPNRLICIIDAKRGSLRLDSISGIIVKVDEVVVAVVIVVVVEGVAVETLASSSLVLTSSLLLMSPLLLMSLLLLTSSLLLSKSLLL